MISNNFKNKTKALLIGKRPFKDRLLTAFFPSLSITFILLFFGPLDLSRIAETYVNYTVLDILLPCLKIWGIAALVLFLTLLIPGGKLHAHLSSLVTGLALAFYVQGNWLNTDLGVLDGRSVEWHEYGDNAIVGFVIFVLILLIPFLVHYYSRRVWRRFVIFLSALLMIMQGVPLGIMLIQEFRNRPPAEHYVMKKDREFVLGQENIVVFILDNTAPTHIGWLQQGYPDALAPFNDFTTFDNFSTDYLGTFPASAYFLTHEPYDWNIPSDEWFKKAWNSPDAEKFYAQLHEKGWNIRVFNSFQHAAGTLENEYGKIDNVEKVEEKAEYTINREKLRQLYKLSFYRYLPLIMKAPFWIYTGDLNSMKRVPEDEQEWNEIESVQKFLDEGGISLGDEARVYISYHWKGAHPPYSLDEQGRLGHGSDQVRQLAGHFYVIKEYIQQMMDLGIYDASTIIITTDHGDFDDPNGILFIKPAGQRQAEMNRFHTPITQAEFMETIAQAAGLEKGLFGESIFDVPEGEMRRRCTYIRSHEDEYPNFPGKGTNAIQEYCFTGDIQTIIQMIADHDYISYPLADPWY